MDTHTITLVGYTVLLSALAVYEILALRVAAIPTLGDLAAVIARSRAGRWFLLVGWVWLGWHLFVRGGWLGH